jgi:hypothetical protein
MKTYKQQNQELWSTIRNLKDELVKQTSLKNVYKDTLDKLGGVDPVVHRELALNFNKCIDALEAIEMLERNGRIRDNKHTIGLVEAIANEVLHQLGKK